MVFKVRIAVRGRSGSSLYRTHIDAARLPLDSRTATWPLLVDKSTASNIEQRKEAPMATVAYITINDSGLIICCTSERAVIYEQERDSILS